MSDAPRLRLAYLCADAGIPVDGSKGAAVHFRELGRALAQDGMELSALVARRDQELAELPFPTRVVRSPGAAGSRRELLQLAATSQWLDALDALGPVDAVYERLALFAVAGSVFSRERSLPHVVEVNAPLLEEQVRYRALRLAALATGAVRETLLHATIVLCVSEGVARHVRGLGVAPERVRVFRNGANDALFANAAPAPRPAGFAGTVLTFVGSLKPWHGISFLLEAFARVRAERRDVHLWVVGDGPHADDVRGAAARDPGGICAQGAVPHEQVAAVLNASDLVVCPYPAEAPGYFAPLKLVEAMAAGCTILASDVESVRAYVQHGVSAWLYQPGDARSFTDGLNALAGSPLLRHQLAAAARETCIRSHTWRARARELRHLIATARDGAASGAAAEARS